MCTNIPHNKLYDLQLIDQMCRGNQEQIKKMVLVFTVEVSKTIEEMEIAISEKDFSRMKSLAHKVKPTLSYFGTISLEKEVIYIEDLLMKNFDMNELESKMTLISEISKKAVDQLKTDFNL